MKTSKLQKKVTSKSGFTLVELLVVIAIIAALATLGTQAGLGAMKRADKVKSQAAVTALANSVEAFYADNNVYPNLGSGTAIETNGQGDGKTLIEALVAEESQPVINVRKIKYLEANEAKNGKNGIDYEGESYSFTDKEGVPYQVQWDDDYDGLIQDPFGGDEIRKGVIAFGRGMNEVSDWEGGTRKEVQAVKSW